MFGQRYAVIMGDIVGSEEAPSLPRLHATFNAAIADANEHYADTIVSPLTVTLGDEFQGLVGNLHDAFLLSCRMRLRLLQKGVACRFVVGTALIETAINPDSAWNMMGPGLSSARRRLNDKADANAHRFVVAAEPPWLHALLDAVGLSMTTLEADWTTTQLDTVAAILNEQQNVSDIATARGISESAVYKTLRAAKFGVYFTQRASILDSLGVVGAEVKLL